MKRLLVLLLCSALLFCGCAKTEYEPMLILSGGLSLHESTIYGKYVNEYFISPYELITTADGSEVRLYSDDTLSQVLVDGETLELFDGMNKYPVIVSNGELEKAYLLCIDCTMILNFYVEVIEDKTYKVGEFFDKSTVSATAKKEDGTIISVSDYEWEFDSSEPGEQRVYIRYGGITRFFDVTVE